MTHSLPISAATASRGFMPLQMQCSAPLRTAEAWGLEAVPPCSVRDRHARGDSVMGRAFAVVLPLAVFFGTGLVFWGLS